MVLFIHLVAPDLELTRAIFALFEGAFRLACNVAKWQMMPI
jgi:hypothetical protein